MPFALVRREGVVKIEVNVDDWTGLEVSGPAGASPATNTTHGLTEAVGGTAWDPTVNIPCRYFVRAAGPVYYEVGPGWGAITTLDTAANDRVNVRVNPALVGECNARGVAPESFVILAYVERLHPRNRALAIPDVSIAAPFNVMPTSLWSLAPAAAGMETVFVRDNGNDANSGHSAAAAWLTIQRAMDYAMATSPRQASLLVDIRGNVAGTGGIFAGDVDCSGISFKNGARLYIIGNPPVATAGYKRLAITAGAGALTQTNDDLLMRFVPNGGDGWMSDVPAPVALVVGDVGKTVRIYDGNNVAYATIANVDAVGGGVGAYVDITMDAVATPQPAAPAWVTAVGTTWDIIGNGDVSWTNVSGLVNLFNISSDPGAATQAMSDATDKYHCIGHIQFSAFPGPTFEKVSRLSTPGCQFTGGTVTWRNCLDCSNAVNAVPQAAESFYFPTAIWLRLGFTGAGTADSWGGLGFFSTQDMTFSTSTGTIAGLVFYRAGGQILSRDRSVIVLQWCSTGPDGGVPSNIMAQTGMVYISSSRLATKLIAQNEGSLVTLGSLTWSPLAQVGDDAPVPGTVTTHTALTFGFLQAMDAGTIYMVGAHGSYEGIVTDAADGVLVHIVNNSNLFNFLGGGDVDFFGNRGWLMADNSRVVMPSGAPVVWQLPSKRNAAVAAYDIVLNNNAAMDVDPNVTISKSAVDNTVGPVLHVNNGSKFIFGDPDTDTGRFDIGDGAGAGIDCGFAQAPVLVENGSLLVIGNPRLYSANANAATRTLGVLFHSEAHFGTTGAINTAYVASNAGGAGPAGAAVNIGVSAVIAGANPVVAVIRNDIPGVPAGTEHLCFYRVN